MPNYNPIQYTNLAAYSSTEILVRLDRTSLKSDRSGFDDLPDDFVEFIKRLDTVSATICPVFLDAVDFLPKPAAVPAPAAPVRQLRDGVREYVNNDLTLFRRDGEKLTSTPSPLALAQVVNVLTNFCIRYSNPGDAVRALAELEAMASVAVAEPAPARYIVAQEPRGTEGEAQPGPVRAARRMGDVVIGGDASIGAISIRGGAQQIAIHPEPAPADAGFFGNPLGTTPGAENLAFFDSPLVRTILAEVTKLHTQIGDLNTNIASMRKAMEACKCCKDDKTPGVPEPSYQQWPFAALHATYDCNRGAGVTVAMFDLGVDFTLTDFRGTETFQNGVNLLLLPRVEAGLANEPPYYWDADDTKWKTVSASATAGEAGQSYRDGLNPNKVLGNHGTAVAGVIAGEFTGFLPKAKIVSFQVSAGKTFSYVDDDGKTVRYFPVDSVLYATALMTLSARNRDVEVLNVSLGGSAPLCEFEKIGYKALGSVNIRVVACSGNHFHKGDDARVLYPARHASVLSVGAVGIEGNTQYYKRAPWSNFDADGYHVNVMAPGVGVYSCLPRSYGKKDNCSWFNGTSFASPWVAAMYAWAVHLNIPFELPEISQKLFYQDPEEPFDSENGYGLVKFDKVEIAGKRKNGQWCWVPNAPSGTTTGYGGTTPTPAGPYQRQAANAAPGTSPFNPPPASE